MTQDEEVYIVEFLVRRVKRVKASDEIQAEIEGFKQLPVPERDRIEWIRVKDAGGNPLHVDPRTQDTWYRPDLDWLKSHIDPEPDR